MKSGLGEPLPVVKLETDLKGRLALLFQLDQRLSFSLKHLIDGDRIFSPFDTDFVDEAVPESIRIFHPQKSLVAQYNGGTE